MLVWCMRACPPKHPLDFVSCSDLPVCTNRLNQPAFGFWPDVLEPLFSVGSFNTEISCHAVIESHDAVTHDKIAAMCMQWGCTDAGNERCAGVMHVNHGPARLGKPHQRLNPDRARADRRARGSLQSLALP